MYTVPTLCTIIAVLVCVAAKNLVNKLLTVELVEYYHFSEKKIKFSFYPILSSTGWGRLLKEGVNFTNRRRVADPRPRPWRHHSYVVKHKWLRSLSTLAPWIIFALKEKQRHKKMSQWSTLSKFLLPSIQTPVVGWYFKFKSFIVKLDKNLKGFSIHTYK